MKAYFLILEILVAYMLVVGQRSEAHDSARLIALIVIGVAFYFSNW